ncbi:hypothetical protein CEXT_548761 [Caerostris extrusa]|uniref:Uncharacterized protein n=1 Tax=Caerostris extrusa TaxID=172846 RepID=A0AAV4RJQ3_CAEEX|nr:hypothetical protein CEXT_548761 [Caerostris extrusa]
MLSDTTSSMLSDNSTSLSTLESSNSLPVILKVTLGGKCVHYLHFRQRVFLLIFSRSLREKRRNNNRYRVIDIILASLAILALCRSVLLGPTQTVSFISGKLLRMRYNKGNFCHTDV